MYKTPIQCLRSSLVVKPVNITIEAELHEKAKAHAQKVHYTDFSGLVTKLLVEDIRREKEASATAAGAGTKKK